MDASVFAAFKDELEKIAAAKKLDVSEFKAEAHLQSDQKDWKEFERDLRSPNFRRAVTTQTDDPKLKRYVKSYGGYLASKDVVTTVPSRTSGKNYTIKRLETGRLACNCKDWQFKHSVKGTDCDHIRAARKSGLLKISSIVRGMGAARILANANDPQRKAQSRWTKDAIKAWDRREKLPEAPHGLFPHHPKGAQRVLHALIES